MTNQRSPTYDLIRLAAVFAVVVTHHAKSLKHASGSPEIDLVATCLFALTHWCVPLFVMLSGALLLREGNALNFSAFYRRRGASILIPTIAWSLVYALVKAFPYTTDSLRDLGVRLALGMPANHLWYLYMLLGLYAATPFIADLCARLPARTVGAAGLALLACYGTDSMFAFLFGTAGERNATFLLSWVPYVGYFVLGATIRRTGDLLRRPIARSVMRAGLLVALGLGLFAHLMLADASPNSDGFLATYVNPVTAVQALLLFALLSTGSFPQPNSRSARWAASLGDMTLGVYLIHPLFYLRWSHELEITAHSPAAVAACASASVLVIAALSFLATALLRRLPILRHTV